MRKAATVALLWAVSVLVDCALQGDPGAAAAVAYADKCELCLLTVLEFAAALRATGATSQVMHTAAGKRVPYRQSESRFHDTMESVCGRFLRYTVHKEFVGAGADSVKRFAPGRSETMRTLHGLVDKGVTVELGMPYEMWDAPSVEIAQLKADCERLLEEYESELETWYWRTVDWERGESPAPPVGLLSYVCAERYLRAADQHCLPQYDAVAEHVDRMRRAIAADDPRAEL